MNRQPSTGKTLEGDLGGLRYQVTSQVRRAPALSAERTPNPRSIAGGADTGKEGGGGFVVPAFAASDFGFGGDELSSKGLGQDRLRQSFGALRRCPNPLFDGVGQLEERFHAADDLVLFRQRRHGNRKLLDLANIQMWGGATSCQFANPFNCRGTIENMHEKRR